MAGKKNWSCLVYPESAPDDWRDRLSDLCVPCYISPLHDMDINFDTGEIKKAHFHVLFRMTQSYTAERFKTEISAKFGGVGAEPVNSFPSYARYLCHLDEDPEKKHHYDPSDVLGFGGIDNYIETFVSAFYDRYKAGTEVRKIILENDMHSFNQLYGYCLGSRPELIRFLMDNLYFVRTLLTDASFGGDPDPDKVYNDPSDEVVESGIDNQISE